MSWAQPQLLWLLVFPALAAARLWRTRGGAPVWPGLARVDVAGSRVQPAQGGVVRKPWLLLLALALAIGALAQPRWGQREGTGEEPAREIMIALDLSRSMLVDDVRPTRIGRAHEVVKQLLDGLHGERAGLIVFAGVAYVQVPLSSDYQILREFLPSLEPGYVPRGGSDFAAMLRAAEGGFSEEKEADRYLFVISDGGSTVDGWQAELARLKARHVQIISLGVGTAAGGDVPPVDADAKSPAHVALEPAMLQALAAGGIYREAGPDLDVKALLAETVELSQRTRRTEHRTEDMAPQFAWLLGPALVAGWLGLWREAGVRPRARTPRRAANPASVRRGATAAVLVVVFLIPLGWHAVSRAHEEGHVFGTEVTAAERLQWLVEDLAWHQAIDARDLQLLAERTIAYGVETLNHGDGVPEGPVRDALAAVKFGQRKAPQQTNWGQLQTDLERFLAQRGADGKERPPEQKKEALDEEDKAAQTNGQGSQQTTSESMGQGGVSKTDATVGELSKASPRRAGGPRPRPRGVMAGNGAGPDGGSAVRVDPIRALTLKRLREVEKGDTPGVLYQALDGDMTADAAGGKDW